MHVCRDPAQCGKSRPVPDVREAAMRSDTPTDAMVDHQSHTGLRCYRSDGGARPEHEGPERTPPGPFACPLLRGGVHVGGRAVSSLPRHSPWVGDNRRHWTGGQVQCRHLKG